MSAQQFLCLLRPVLHGKSRRHAERIKGVNVPTRWQDIRCSDHISARHRLDKLAIQAAHQPIQLCARLQMSSGHLARLCGVKAHQIQQCIDFMRGQFLTNDMQPIWNQSILCFQKGDPKPVQICAIQMHNLSLSCNQCLQRFRGHIAGRQGPPLTEAVF